MRSLPQWLVHNDHSNIKSVYQPTPLAQRNTEETKSTLDYHVKRHSNFFLNGEKGYNAYSLATRNLSKVKD